MNMLTIMFSSMTQYIVFRIWTISNIGGLGLRLKFFKVCVLCRITTILKMW